MLILLKANRVQNSVYNIPFKNIVTGKKKPKINYTGS